MGDYDLPPMGRIPENLDELGLRLFEIEEYKVASWCPARNGRGPATQVHVQFTLKGQDTAFVFRFKSAAECDRFVAAMQRHRADVWPHKRPPLPR